VIFSVAVEGPTDLAAARRLLEHAGHSIGRPYVQGGKNQLNARLRAYNDSAAKQNWPWLVLRDLDRDADCAPFLISALLPKPSPLMKLRIAVRALEAWLIADSAGMAEYLGVNATSFSDDPDSVIDPKALLVRAASRSAHKHIRAAIVPNPGVAARVGRDYTAELITFIRDHWSIDRAVERSDSLRRCLAALRRV
jgi:hypothetical protein